MNREFTFRVLMVFVVLSTLVVLSTFVLIGFSVILLGTVSFVLVVFWIFIELYLRIQHNLDQNYLRIQHNLDQNYLRIQHNLDQDQKTKKAILSSIEKVRLDLKTISKNQTSLTNKIDLSFDSSLRYLKSNFRLSVGREILKRMLAVCPRLFCYKSVLYIGASQNRFSFIEEFRDANYNISVLEAFKPNVDFLRKLSWIKEVIHADIRNFQLTKKYDVIFWWHGPEHVSLEDLKVILKKLETVCNRVVVLGCPWGESKQGTVDGNVYEQHLSSIGLGLFEKEGYHVNYLGQANLLGSNIIAIKQFNKSNKS